MKRLTSEGLIELTIKPAVEFMEGFKSSDKAVIICGHDCDSICSAVIIFKFLSKVLSYKPKIVVSKLNFSVSIKQEELEGSSHVIILDIPHVSIDIISGMRRKGKKVLIIDHHLPKGYVGVVYCNPRIYDISSYFPTSYITYKIYEKFFDASEVAWIAGIGTLADNGMRNCEDLFLKLKSSNYDLVDEIEMDDKVLFEKALLGKLTSIVDSARIVKGIPGVLFALDILCNVENPESILEMKNSRIKKLVKLYNIMQTEFAKIIKDFDRRKKETKSGVVVYEVKSKFDFKSPIASFLANNRPVKILVVYQKKGKFYEFSFRRGENVDVNLGKLAERLVKDIHGASGGGHPAAAAARIPKEALKQFLKRLEI